MFPALSHLAAILTSLSASFGLAAAAPAVDLSVARHQAPVVVTASSRPFVAQTADRRDEKPNLQAKDLRSYILQLSAMRQQLAKATKEAKQFRLIAVSNSYVPRHEGDGSAPNIHSNSSEDHPSREDHPHRPGSAGSSTSSTSTGQVSKPSTSISNGGFVSLNFDDGDVTAFNSARPIVEAAGFPATYYIVSQQLGDRGFSGYITTDQVKQLQTEGNEVADHTRDHAHLNLLTPNDVHNEIVGAKQDLADLGISPDLSFAYPYGEVNNAIENEVKNDGFIGARGTGDGLNTKDTDPFDLRADSLDRTTTFDHVKNLIDKAVAENSWYIITIHAIDKPGEFYSVSPSLVTQIVNYLKDNNVPVATNAQGLREFINSQPASNTGNGDQNQNQNNDHGTSTDNSNSNDHGTQSITLNRVDDRLWKSDKINVNGNTRYTYSDQYKSSTVNDIDLRFFFDDGRTVDVQIERFPERDNWQNAQINFATPSGAKAMVIYHLANPGGQLDVRDFQLAHP
jgi:peptidoglycan/xylan/chitin deacetylase (PgdA/CDA1 family)